MSRNRELLPFPYPWGRGDLRAKEGQVTTGNAFDLACMVQSDPEAARASLVEGAFYSGERFWMVPSPELAEWLRPLDATVIYYARPQVDQLTASYSQQLRNNGYAGSLRDWVESAAGRKKYYERYATLSATSKVIVRKYDRELFPQGDVVLDLFEALNIAPPQGAVHFRDVNPTPPKTFVTPEDAWGIVQLFWDDNLKLRDALGPRFDLNADNVALAEKVSAGSGAQAHPSASPNAHSTEP